MDTEMGGNPKEGAQQEQVNNESQENQQPASDEQPNAEEEINGETIEMLEQCKKRQRRQSLLEKAMFCVMVMIVVSMVGWIVCGKWINAVNNLLWLFVAWMYWRQQRLFLSAGKLVLNLLYENINFRDQIKNYGKMLKIYAEKDDIWHQLQQSYKTLIANSEQRIAKLEELAEKQDNLIEYLKE